jgi:threonine-phosphate decarboxylase
MRRALYPFADPAPLFRHGGTRTPCPDSVLDFSININPLGPPLGVPEVLRDQSRAIARYPDSECTDLTRRLASLHDLGPEQIVVGNGSTQLIYAVARCFGPGRVAIVEPTFTEYLRASSLVGAVTEHWLAAETNFDVEPFDPGQAKLIWICNPNNPTGGLWPPGLLADWIRELRATTFVVDEAFLPFLEQEQQLSLIGELGRLPNLIVLRSMTKLYALAGLRLGYAVASAPLANSIRTQLPPWSVNGLAQSVGLAALEDRAFLKATRAWFRVERESFDRALSSLCHGLEVVPSRANFTLLRLRQGSSAWLVRALAERGIVVREASNFIGLSEGYFRVALRTPPDNERLLHELGSLLGEKGGPL